jgi:hypothetical protein
MTTIFVVYNLKREIKEEEYENYLAKTKIPTMRESWFVKDFKTWKIDKVLAPVVFKSEWKLSTETPYQYVAKIEVVDLNAMESYLLTEGGKQFLKSWSAYIDPSTVLTLGHEM